MNTLIPFMPSPSFRHLVGVLFVLVAISPATSQTIIEHQNGASGEDGVTPYDADGIVNKVVVWQGGAIHIVMNDYSVYSEYELRIEQGAIVKLKNRLFVSGAIQIQGAILTDYRDDETGGDTNHDGNATVPPSPGNLGWQIEFSGTARDLLTRSTIKHCHLIGNVGSMKITDNTFLALGQLASYQLSGQQSNRTLGAVPFITENTFECAGYTPCILLQGQSPIIENDTIRYSPESDKDKAIAAGVVIQPTYYRHTADSKTYYPQNGKAIVVGNTFETNNGIEISGDNESYANVQYRAEIQNNTFKGVGGPNTKGRGARALQLRLDAETLVSGNEVSNFRVPVYFSSSSESVSRLTVTNNRFLIDWPTEFTGIDISEMLWRKGIFVKAENNYWGHPSGPLDNSDWDGLYNPRGKGFQIGNGIDYVPFIGGTATEAPDEIHITATSGSPSPLTPEADVTFNVTVDKIRLESASSGRIIITVRDDASDVLEGTSETSVTSAQASATLPAFTVKIPDDSRYITVEAMLIPTGDTGGPRSNEVQFKVDHEARFAVLNVVELPDGKTLPRPMRGKKVQARVTLQYTLNTPGNGSFEFRIEERVRGKKDVVKSYPVVTKSVPPGINLNTEQDLEVDLPLRDVQKEPVTDLYAKVYFKDDKGSEIGEPLRMPITINEPGTIDLFGMAPTNSDGSSPSRNHFIVGQNLLFMLGYSYGITLPDVTDWQIWFGPIEAFDAGGHLLKTIEAHSGPHVTPLFTVISTIGMKAYMVENEVAPPGTRKLRMHIRLRTPAGITVATDHLDTEARENVETVEKDVAPGASQVSYDAVGTSLSFTSNKTAGHLTAEKVPEPFTPVVKKPAYQAASKTSDYVAWKFIPINCYWSLYGDLKEGDFQARVSFSYNRTTDFPSTAGFNEDSLVIAGLNPLSGELEVLPSVLDNASHKVTTDYSTFFQTYVVAAKKTVVISTPVEEPEALPDSYALEPNYPNPFSESTTFVFHLPAAQEVRLMVYDVLGRVVTKLVDGPYAAGVHHVTWDGRDASDRRVASNVYLVRLQAGRFVQVRTIVVVR